MISVIIVSYNVCGYLRNCLNSIYESKSIHPIEVIVVDNYSGIDKKDYHEEAEEESLNDSKKSFMKNLLGN